MGNEGRQHSPVLQLCGVLKIIAQRLHRGQRAGVGDFAADTGGQGRNGALQIGSVFHCSEQIFLHTQKIVTRRKNGQGEQGQNHRHAQQQAQNSLAHLLHR